MIHVRFFDVEHNLTHPDALSWLVFNQELNNVAISSPSELLYYMTAAVHFNYTIYPSCHIRG